MSEEDSPKHVYIVHFSCALVLDMRKDEIYSQCHFKDLDQPTMNFIMDIFKSDNFWSKQ